MISVEVISIVRFTHASFAVHDDYGSISGFAFGFFQITLYSMRLVIEFPHITDGIAIVHPFCLFVSFLALLFLLIFKDFYKRPCCIRGLLSLGSDTINWYCLCAIKDDVLILFKDFIDAFT